MGEDLPVLFSEFKGDVLTVELLVELPLQFQVDALVLLRRQQQGRETQQGEARKDTQLTRTEESQERSEHQQ